MGSSPKPHPAPESDILAELERILASREFANADRISRFLRFVVEHTLAGDRDSLKESVIGGAVFDRPPDYDPKTEPIVRIEARRLRSKLEEYYAQSGRNWSVRISVPKGGYIAAFEPRPQPILFPLRPEPAPPEPPEPAMAGPDVVELPPRAELPAARSPRRWIWVAAAAAVATIAFSALLLTRSPHPQTLSVEKTITSYVGLQHEPSLSPDGNEVAFVWGGEAQDNTDIYVAMTSGGSPRRITTDAASDEYPSWSPDGSQLAFVRAAHWLMLTTPLGGNERRLTTAYNSKLSWTPGGKDIVFVDSIPGQDRFAVFEVNIATGVRRQITSTTTEPYGDVTAAVSPDGDDVAFVRCVRRNCDVWATPISGGEPRRVTHESYPGLRGITWTPDGRTLIFSARAGSQSYRLWQVAANGRGDPEPVSLSAENAGNPSFSRSGPVRLAYEHWIQDSNVWRFRRGTNTTDRLIASTTLDSSPQISPDGHTIVFASDRTGSTQIWKTDSEGRNAVQLTNSESGYPGSPRWSPDGTKIAFDLMTDKGRAIFVMDAASGHATQWTGWKEAARPSWSPDGQWILYSERGAGDQMQIWKVSASDRHKTIELTTDGGFEPFESPDGKTIYFTKSPSELWDIPAQGGPAARVVAHGVYHGWWAVSDRGIYYVDVYAGTHPAELVPRTPKPIYLLPYGAKTPIQVGAIAGEVIRATPDFTVSADGQTILYSVLETSVCQIRLLENP